MGRQLRPQLPGMPFHVTARLQGRAAWFTGLEHPVEVRICAAPRRSDATLLSYAVMPNHLHLVVVQGSQPLSQLMQPLLTRIALLVQRRTGHAGHIFERRFTTSPCLDPDYLRNAIGYVHLNGLRAELCSDVSQYEWCSHHSYVATCDRPGRMSDVAVEGALRLFAPRKGASLTECRTNYQQFLEWRCAVDRQRAAEATGMVTEAAPQPPITAGGDLHWASTYASVPIRPRTGRTARPDLREIARATLLDVAPDMELEILRSGYRTKAIVNVRRRFILRASAAGHRGGTIARFLSISPTTVSSVRTAAMHEGR
jgi:REP element-mobilizing transposase RayT